MIKIVPALVVAVLIGGDGIAMAADPVDYATRIKPILVAHCYACHGALKQESGLRLDTGALVRKGGESGPAAFRTKAQVRSAPTPGHPRAPRAEIPR